MLSTSRLDLTPHASLSAPADDPEKPGLAAADGSGRDVLEAGHHGSRHRHGAKGRVATERDAIAVVSADAVRHRGPDRPLITPVAAEAHGAIQDLPFSEPPLRLHPAKWNSAGAVVVEPTGDIWVHEPAGHYGNYTWSFPKGRIDEGETARQAAHREVREETGLHMQALDYLCDQERSSSVTRYYLARCVGGDPAAFLPNETAQVCCVPLLELPFKLNQERDRHVLANLCKSSAFSAMLNADGQHCAEGLPAALERAAKYWSHKDRKESSRHRASDRHHAAAAAGTSEHRRRSRGAGKPASSHK